MREKEISFDTSKSLSELGVIIKNFHKRPVKCSAMTDLISRVTIPGEAEADVSILLEGQTLFGGHWAVQVYVAEMDYGCAVSLIALGTGIGQQLALGVVKGLGGNVNPRSDIINFRTSIRKANKIKELFE
ncbi:hypothetical protein [Streptococcus sp. A22]